MKRVLRIGGRLVIIDGYRKRPERDEGEREIVRRFCLDFRLKELCLSGEMTKVLELEGMTRLKVDDVTAWIMPNRAKIRWLNSLSLPIRVIARVSGWQWVRLVTDNAEAMSLMMRGVESGLGGYFIHTGVKRG